MYPLVHLHHKSLRFLSLKCHLNPPFFHGVGHFSSQKSAGLWALPGALPPHQRWWVHYSRPQPPGAQAEENPPGDGLFNQHRYGDIMGIYIWDILGMYLGSHRIINHLITLCQTQLGKSTMSWHFTGKTPNWMGIFQPNFMRTRPYMAVVLMRPETATTSKPSLELDRPVHFSLVAREGSSDISCKITHSWPSKNGNMKT